MMKVTVCFDNIRVVVPCGDGSLLVRDLMHEAITRYKKATGKSNSNLTISSLSSLTGGGILDPDDRLCDVADDREQIVAHFMGFDSLHAGGDGASSVGTNSPDFVHGESKEHRMYTSRSTGNIKRESTKRLSMHALSTREPCLTTYSALSLPRESRRKEPLGQDAKALHEVSNFKPVIHDQREICEIVLRNEAGPLGLHVVPCIDLSGNGQGLKVEGIEPNGTIARDGQIDLHDKIIKINRHNLLGIPYQKVDEIFRSCMNEPCLQISVVKHKKSQEKNVKKTLNESNSSDKTAENDDSIKRLQCANYNVLQTANTRKIGKMIEIELTKGNNGLGFSVTTRDNPAGGHCPIYIKNILPKGAAVEDGRLKPGDRLLEVNNLEMTGKSQAEVVALLRSIPPGGKVKLVVSRQEEVSANTSDSNIGVPVVAPDVSKGWKPPQESPVKKKEESIDTYDKCNYKTMQVSDDVVLSPKKNRIILTLDIPVHDSEKAGLGVSVKGKTSTSEESSSIDLGIFIKSVIHGGAASRDGRLRMNDQLLNINGVTLLGLSNSDAMETLRRAMLSPNSSGIITLTIARRMSSYESSPEKNCTEKIPSKLEPTNNMYMLNSNTKRNDGYIKEKNSFNSQDILDDGLLSASASPWNPVVDRLAEQYNKNSLRNESYCIATKTWMDPVSIVKKHSIGQRDENLESVLLEDSNENSHHANPDTKKIPDDKESQYSGDPTYDSQLSLEEFNSSTNKFSRDALGRQSMSEKRHAALDAKNTDTYKRNKKLREGRENSNKSDEQKNHSKKEFQVDSFGTTNSSKSSISIGESSKHSQSEYLYTIPGCNSKHIPPRKHWLVDDVQTSNVSNNSNNSNNSNKEEHGFSNTRGDIKQASLNSALDDRYKRSRKKTGIRSMLRLGKNRKSLNFGDNIENRHESIIQPIRTSVFTQQKRFRGKINIQKPRAPHHERGKVLKFSTPFISNPDSNKPLSERCLNITASKKKEARIKIVNPYEQIIARECLNWFKSSNMVAFFHMNSMTSEQQFEFAVPLKKANMYLKGYQGSILNLALKDTIYEATLKLVQTRLPKSLFVFSPDTNVEKLVKIAKKTPQVILIAGILNGRLLNVNEFLKYGKLDLMTAQAGLVQVLRTAAGGNLNRQLTHHQSTLVTRLKQIGTKEEEKPCDVNE